MRGAHAHPHRELADRERADPMHAGDAPHAEACQRFGDDALAFLVRERLERLVLEPRARARPSL